MRVLVLLVFALYGAAASAQLYSWKDADGKVQYSDQPPPGQTPARKVAAPATLATDPAGTRKMLAEKELESRKKRKTAQEADANAEKEKADAEERRANCEKAKGNLQAMESGLTRFTANARGERVALEGAVRDAELGSARKAVEAWCK